MAYNDCENGRNDSDKNPFYDPDKPCSDCDPIRNPSIQPQITSCGVQGGMFGNTRGVASNCQGQFHGGVDIATGLGDNIYAMFSGTAQILQQGDGSAGAGFYVKITSNINGEIIDSYYFHLEENNRVSGDVKVGDVIGVQGTFGNLANGIAQGTTDTHVHIKVKLNGTTVDPLPYFNTEFNNSTGEISNSNCD